MKIVFLDIDGVLNSAYGEEPYESDMEVSKLVLLKKLLIESNADGVVITSDRRYSAIDMRQKIEAFQNHDINIIGRTRDPDIKDFQDNRGKQIADYLSNLTEDISHIVILDDNDEGISNLFPDEFIHINRVFGLNEEICKKALEILKS